MLLFSFIIPSFNRASYLERAIDSILSQSLKEYEIIIVDDGSTDNTFDVVKEYSGARINYFKITNRERGAARNYGLQRATGKYVNYFDSDDLFLPCLERLSKFIEDHNDPDVIYGNIEHIDDKGKVIGKEKLPYKSFTKNLLHNNFMACGSVFLKQEIAQQFLFHENRQLSSAEDWELWLRIHTKCSFTHFPHSVFQQIHHSNRSLSLIDPSKIEARDVYFASLVFRDGSMRKFYGNSALNLFVADRYTFISLAWSGKDSKKSFYYWTKAISNSALVMTRKRFWAIFKKFIIRND